MPGFTSPLNEMNNHFRRGGATVVKLVVGHLLLRTAVGLHPPELHRPGGNELVIHFPSGELVRHQTRRIGEPIFSATGSNLVDVELRRATPGSRPPVTSHSVRRQP